MFRNRYFWLICATVAPITGHNACAAVAPISQYGLVQNVQNYSSNPFYNPNSYNVSAPKIIYAPGPSLKPADCLESVKLVIENICAKRNRCKNTTLADIRPEAMVMLSKLPGYNFSSSCGGYIDQIYTDYMKQNATANFPVSTNFPMATTKNKNTTTPQSEYEQRANELKELQAQTNTIPDGIVHTDFPTTFQDLSLAEQNEIKRQGYEPYKDAQVYIPLNISSKENTSEEDTSVVIENTESESDVVNTTTNPTMTMAASITTNSTQLSDYEKQCINTQKTVRSTLSGNNDDFFCFNNTKSGSSISAKCFKADSNACVKNTAVCILGQQGLSLDEIPNKIKKDTAIYTHENNALIGSRLCAISYEGKGSDNWYKKYQPRTIPDCTGQKWKQNSDIDKTNPVMVYKSLALVNNDNKEPQEYFVKYYETPTFPGICIGYYCKTSDGKYQEPTNDGLCQ